MSIFKKDKLDDLSRVEVDETKVVDVDSLKNVLSSGINKKTLSKLSVDELKYMLEYENNNDEVVELIRYYINKKQK